MRNSIVFAFRYTSPRTQNFHFIFDKSGLYSGSRSPEGYICPLEHLDWGHSELRSLETQMPSVLLRCMMFASIVSSDSWGAQPIIATSDYYNIENSLVIYHKSICCWDNAKRIKSKNNILVYDIVDYVDDALKDNVSLIDGILVSSHRGMDIYQSLPWIDIPLFHLPYGPNARLQERTYDLNRFSPLYNGDPANIVSYPSLEPLLNIAYCDKLTPMDVWLQKTQDANFFYAIRPKIHNLRVKPFIKGFNAAKLNANILIHKDDGDALFYLGKDYPYLVSEPISEKIVLEYMEKAKKEFGGPEWKRGLGIMQRMRDAFSPETMARGILNIIAYYQ